MTTTSTVELINPHHIKKNPANPRLVFRQDELDALTDSIREQGILVPLAVYRIKNKFMLIDGERRWRCAIILGLNKVPAYIQERPNATANIMMMFAIHNARKDWDPLPTALKLGELETRLKSPKGKLPTIRKLAAAASLSPGEVRRYKKILAIPKEIQTDLLKELEKPRYEQKISVDHAIEAIAGCEQLLKNGIIQKNRVLNLTETIVEKFRSGVLTNTTEPRKLARVARAVERGEISKDAVRAQIRKFVDQKNYTIEGIYKALVEDSEFAHQTRQLILRLTQRLTEMSKRSVEVDNQFIDELMVLVREATNFLRHVSEGR